ncbi:hypothetical protein M501DRAFT_253293 [Patellaria atrata CBS 101060]|uniref:Uncharacterized protein n=1 Tax=Patellaria atrata CBS 101060 TaxID=1346257 RepID=A0A9P4S5D0_9PEZI|nr:hypothetical protein M501DRAFT_253293 [Patellaria atrata CBS 101060]
MQASTTQEMGNDSFQQPTTHSNPEAIETMSKSSCPSETEVINTPLISTQPFVSEPIESSVKRSRRFIPEPVGMTIKSTPGIMVETMEVTAKSSQGKEEDISTTRIRRRFAPEPLEITVRSNRVKGEGKDSSAPAKGEVSDASSKPRRKFAPQLIETAKRTRKSGDRIPAVLPTDKTEVTPGTATSRRERLQPIPERRGQNPTQSSLQLLDPALLEARRLGSCPSANRSSSRASIRTPSFRVPDLEPIESSESEESAPTSPATTPPSRVSSFLKKQPGQAKDGADKQVSGYLLELAAKAAEVELREQAMAAFPNDDFHEPINHFVDRDSEDVSARTSMHDEEIFKLARRYSTAEANTINWELREMLKHQEQLAEQRRKEQESSITGELDIRNSPGPWKHPGALFAHEGASEILRKLTGGPQEDSEINQMRKGARPPMLGGDIKFPRCASPDRARFDVTQGCATLRAQMCYLSEQSAPPSPEGLWNGSQPSRPPSLWSQAGSRAPSNGGLWGGCCAPGESPLRGPTGLMTPRSEHGNSIETGRSTPGLFLAPLSPPQSLHDISSLEARLQKEQAVEDEFGDSFITQVYNYLSLGYPSIARAFDHELSKISHYSIRELRQDDHLAESRGYIRLGEAECSHYSDISEETCMRWKALRLYIREWARQQPRMVPEHEPAWGMAVRKGSWVA